MKIMRIKYFSFFCICCSVLIYSEGVISSSQQLIVTNNLKTSSVCPLGNTLTVFPPNSAQINIQTNGAQAYFSGDFSQLPGLGLQINNWYWIATKTPVQSSTSSRPQNPDNSGSQLTISSDCKLLQKSAPWYGKGIQSYLVADIKVVKNNSGVCELIVSTNPYTDAVTPTCCSPPGNYQNICQSAQWGETQNGLSWPPPQ